MANLPKIVIIGGGTAGLELATKLGKELGKKELAEITLIDPNRTHLWKPLLHEVASGSLDTGHEALSYRAHSAENFYYFRLGTLESVNIETKTIELAPLRDHHNKVILTKRSISYDYLVLAVGAQSNDFGVKGVKEYCYTLDNSVEAEDFHLTILNRFLQFSEMPNQSNKPISITIVGAGATGVELAAELYNAADRLEQYGVKNIHHNSIEIHLIESAAKILPFLAANISTEAEKTLIELGVDIHTSTTVRHIEKHNVVANSNHQDVNFHSDLTVWAAGVKAPEFLSKIGLSTNRINQIKINEYLQSVDHCNIYALGDCANFTPKGAKNAVAPTAQAAHQMAIVCAENIKSQILNKQQLKPFVYHDYGTLVSLSRFQTLGSLLDQLFHKKWTISGTAAEIAYASLYRKHQLALHGPWKTAWILLSHLIEKRVKPKLKLY